MTDIEQLIRAAADLAPRAHGLTVTAHRLAHRHRRRQWGTATVAALGLAVAAVAATGPLTHSGSAGSTAGRDRVCTGGYGRPVASSTLAGSAALLSNDSAFRIVSPVLARMETPSCGRPAVPLAYRQVSGSSVVKAFYVSGPTDEADEETFDPPPVPIAVRGGIGRLLVISGGASTLFWTDEPNHAWRLVAHGLSPQQMVTVANGLVLGATVTLVPSAVPAGMTAQPSIPAGDTKERPEFLVTFSAGAAQYEVQVGYGGLGTTELAAGQGSSGTLVDVNGHEGLLINGAQPHTVALEWQQSPGVPVTVYSQSNNASELEAFARTLVAVDKSDPRLSDTPVQ